MKKCMRIRAYPYAHPDPFGLYIHVVAVIVIIVIEARDSIIVSILPTRTIHDSV